MPHPVKLKKKVVNEIRKHAESSLSSEVAGLLLGSIHKDSLLVSDVVTGEQVSSRTHVSLQDKFLVRVAFEYGRRGKKKSVVGWYHSHPELGCFVSQIDFETQKRFQALFPDAVGLIVDPSLPEKLEVFRIDDDKVEQITDYTVS
ncbi:MAG: Mov34/MPN/PAD-1 family protein [Candidatus Atabeyarchaeum deiterrae]